MHVAFFYRERILFGQLVLHGQTLNGESYLSMLRKVHREITDKRPQLHDVVQFCFTTMPHNITAKWLRKHLCFGAEKFSFTLHIHQIYP